MDWTRIGLMQVPRAMLVTQSTVGGTICPEQRWQHISRFNKKGPLELMDLLTIAEDSDTLKPGSG